MRLSICHIFISFCTGWEIISEMMYKKVREANGDRKGLEDRLVEEIICRCMPFCTEYFTTSMDYLLKIGISCCIKIIKVLAIYTFIIVRGRERKKKVFILNEWRWTTLVNTFKQGPQQATSQYQSKYLRGTMV